MSQPPTIHKSLLFSRVLSLISIGSSIVAFAILSGVFPVTKAGLQMLLGTAAIILPLDALILSGIAMFKLKRMQAITTNDAGSGQLSDLIQRGQRLSRLAIVFSVGALATLLHAVLYKGLMDVF